jgi:hypothetical protein
MKLAHQRDGDRLHIGWGCFRLLRLRPEKSEEWLESKAFCAGVKRQLPACRITRRPKIPRHLELLPREIEQGGPEVKTLGVEP